MNTAEPPVPAPAEATLEPAELSLAEHEQAFGPGRERATTPAATAEPAPPAEPAPSAPESPERDERGQFKTRPPSRARSHAAQPDDVPRIAALTARLREAERERDALKTEHAATIRPMLPEPVPAVRPPEVAPATRPARPKPEDFEDTGGEFSPAYFEALADWKIAEARAADRAEREDEARLTADRAEAARVAASWAERAKAAEAVYPDFVEVALEAPTAIPAGSLVDAWILEHKAGAHVLYRLQKHPEELTALLALPLFEQVDVLSQLALRLLPSTRVPAASTGAAATTATLAAPRPPTPVRTGPVRTAEEPPGDEASLADHEKWWPARRRRA